MSPENRNLEFDLPEEILVLPLVCQEGLRDVLELHREIQQQLLEQGKYTTEQLNLRGITTKEEVEDLPWGDKNRIRPARNLGEIREITPQIYEHAQGVFVGFRAFKTLNLSWVQSERLQYFKVLRMIVNLGRKGALEAVAVRLKTETSEELHPLLRENLERGLVEQTDLARSALERAMIKDQPGLKENPFYHILGLRKLGSINDFFRQDEDQERLVVHFRVVLDDGSIAIACLAFADQESLGELKTIQAHRDLFDCRENPEKVWEVEFPRGGRNK